MLRMAVGATAVIQGAAYLTDRGVSTFEIWVIALIVVLSGILLLLGFLTPVAGGLVAVTTACTALSWFPKPTPNLFSSPLPAVLVVIMGAAVAILGPGSLSVDCRLFGRREIIIPQVPRAPRP